MNYNSIYSHPENGHYLVYTNSSKEALFSNQPGVFFNASVQKIGGPKVLRNPDPDFLGGYDFVFADAHHLPPPIAPSRVQNLSEKK